MEVDNRPWYRWGAQGESGVADSGVPCGKAAGLLFYADGTAEGARPFCKRPRSRVLDVSMPVIGRRGLPVVIVVTEDWALTTGATAVSPNLDTLFGLAVQAKAKSRPVY